MITKESLIKRHKERVKEYKKDNTKFGSLPESLFNFKTGNFNYDNWNGGDSVIRQLTGRVIDNHFCEITYDYQYTKDFVYDDMYGEIIMVGTYSNDHSYIQILINYNDEDEFEIDQNILQYAITYYKNRGKTDQILKNGIIINFEEYLKLLNIIESSGFKFNL